MKCTIHTEEEKWRRNSLPVFLVTALKSVPGWLARLRHEASAPGNLAASLADTPKS